MTMLDTPGVGLDTSDSSRDGAKGPVKDVRDKWERADRALMKERRDYWLNLAFFYGEQWVYWHSSSTSVAEFPRPKGSDRVRLTINRIQPNLVNVLAKLTKRPLAFEVLSSSASDDTIAGARLAEQILEASHEEQGWEDPRNEALLNTFLGGTSAVVLEWDGTAGKELDVDDDSGRVVGTGEVQLTALSIAEFAMEPGSRRAKDARWFIMAQSLPPEQVQEKYGMKERPKADVAFGNSPIHRRLLEERGYPSDTELTTVLTYYERPQGSRSKGKYQCVVGDQLVHNSSWPFPFERLPIAVFRQTRLPMRWTGHTFVNDARPVQAAYNHARSNMAEHMKLAGNARLTIPDTSMEYAENLTDEPGEIIYFDGTQPGRPGYLEPPNIPRWLIQEADRLSAELDDLMCVHAVSRGEAPGDRNSGLALSVLTEKDDTPLGLMAHEQSAGWSDIGSMVLELYAAKVPEKRTATIRTEAGVPVAIEWTGKMLRDQTRCKVPLDNVLPHSRAALQAWLMNLSQNFPQVAGTLQGPQLARMLDLPGTGFLNELLDADAGKAQAENHLFGAEQPVLPEQFDDHGKHIAEHNRWRKSRSYEYGSQETRMIADLHVMAHQRLAEEEAARQMDANALVPGLGGIPQAHEPAGSQVPPDLAERQAEVGQQALGRGGGSGGPPPGMQ